MEESEFMERYSGCRITYDDKRGPLVSMPVKDIPLKFFESWMICCDKDHRGIRWEKINGDHLQARLYEAMLAQPVEETVEKDDSLGLLKGGK